jgi:hypothetical protein
MDFITSKNTSPMTQNGAAQRAGGMMCDSCWQEHPMELIDVRALANHGLVYAWFELDVLWEGWIGVEGWVVSTV